ncbi:hypothetical protein PRZ48_000532 [Zasmidium cellare]|uniref:Uncharacterized protein n=1 Tax=Zasmidium cellare TaxID=395010 RepID=A0ABR0EYR7_ZASCE|nr:hypothetical protein PRZ48_000532 [Zasmidium cellare]
MAQSPLLSLPKELREQIYINSFLPLPTTTTKRPHPSEPPLTRVSQVMRRESLPLFYSLTPLHTTSTLDRTSYNKAALRYYPWYHDLPASRFQYLKLFVLEFKFLERYFGEPVTITFEIKLVKGGKGWVIQYYFEEGWLRDPNRRLEPGDCEEVVGVLRGHFEGVLGELVKGEEGVVLDAEGLDRLLEVDTETLP